MTLVLVTVVPLGLLGILAGLAALALRHRGAAKACALFGLLTMLSTLAVHGWLLFGTFSTIANVPPEHKAKRLADAIAAAQVSLPLGMGLAMVCVVLSAVAWWTLRGGPPHEASTTT